eukprot:1160993-Pelagomonas_calceolata.AAC.6
MVCNAGTNLSRSNSGFTVAASYLDTLGSYLFVSTSNLRQEEGGKLAAGLGWKAPACAHAPCPAACYAGLSPLGV